ncbi:hypothetical protein Cch01nite_34800 [Cellulomonas chitinilytica]|uniref:Uncharacterized protein n=1 Tax=Cellulomonas chitinilytica TaxID=398759 RepID=A0A919P715_9CELL|nr:hypothetical protein [Cellulomonas chitinilytica]GIG22756.1 hypothetical protein Cch01nite_34800 [Cellulomonas chitinilytica]
MSSTTPGTRVQGTIPLRLGSVRWVLLGLLVLTAAVVSWGVHERDVAAGYADAFERGGVAAVVQHAADRGDTVTVHPGGVQAPGGCYLVTGVRLEHLTSADECAQVAALAARATS